MPSILETKSLKLTAKTKHSSKKNILRTVVLKTSKPDILKNLSPILLVVSRVLRTFLNAKDIAPIESNCRHGISRGDRKQTRSVSRLGSEFTCQITNAVAHKRSCFIGNCISFAIESNSAAHDREWTCADRHQSRARVARVVAIGRAI